MTNEQYSNKDQIINGLRHYLTQNYSNTPKLAITMDCRGRYADIVLYIHRTDDTWHTIAFNISERSFEVRGVIVRDKWEGWRIVTDNSQSIRFAPSREEVNHMHRLRDIIASEECIPWQQVSAYLLYPVGHNPKEHCEWYGNMELLEVGALPYGMEGGSICINYIQNKISKYLY